MNELRRKRARPESRSAPKSANLRSARTPLPAEEAALAIAPASFKGPGAIGAKEIGALQRLVGNGGTTQLLSNGPRPDGDSPLGLFGNAARNRPVGAVQRGVVQRHLPGVLAKLAEDLTKVRAALGAYDTADPTNGNLLEYINKHVTDINALPGMVTILDSKPKLIEQLAIDMAARAEPPTAVNASHTASATDEVMNKGGGGFTAKDGTVYMLESTKDSSALYHELIHVLSGEGGVTQLSVTKTNLNEGFTNYFAEQLARKYGKTVYTAYPVATTWVNDLVAKCTENTAYNIYFKNNEALLYSTLAGRLKTKVQAAKTVFDKPESKALKESNGVKRTDLGAFYTGATIKDDAVLAAAVKKKIQEAYFMDAGEPSIAWLKRLCIDD